MIWLWILQGMNYLIHSIFAIMDAIFAPFGLSFTVTQLPFGTDTSLSNAFGVIYAVAGYFPPLVTIIHCVLFFLAYLLVRLILQLLLGHRHPA